jgi:PAS domain S-box-containing protein
MAVSVLQMLWAVTGDRRRGEAALRARAERVVARLAVALQAPLYSFDGATAGDVAAAELAAHEVVGVRVEGTGVTFTWRGQDGVAVAAAALPEGPGLVSVSATVMEPPSIPSPRPLAKVTAVLSPHLLEAEWGALVWRRILETLGLAVAIAAAGWVLLLRNVVRPLERIRAAMVTAREALSAAPGASLPAGDPLAGAFPELRAMGADYRRLAEAVRESRAALAAQEADLRATLDSIGDGVITTDAAGLVLAMNPMAERITGLPAAEGLGRPLAEVFAPGGELALAQGGLVAAVLARGAAFTPADPIPLRARGGQERWVMASAAPVRRPGGEAAGVVAVFRDVTVQRALEDQVRQAQKVEAIGQLAGGVAHDFNNMLTPVLAYAQLIREAPEASEEVRSHAEVVVETATRAAALTRQLLAFSRKGAKSRRTVAPGKLVEETAALLRRTLDRSIDVQLDLQAAGALHGDAALVQNALLNLSLNARDAMPRGGVLRLASRDVLLAAEDCLLPGFQLRPGPHLELSVADTGTGIPPEVLARIFEPFFTTKEAGQGTGLGLAAVHGTMTEHGGAVLVHSIPGRGTTFRLLFPAVAAAAPTAAPEPPRARRPRQGCALVVEDEARIRQLVVREIGALGFQVVEACDGEEALAALARPQTYDVAILDLVLPRLAGRQVFLALRAQRPDVPVLLTSGFARDDRLSDLLQEPAVGFLEKPWRPSELHDALERLLG